MIITLHPPPPIHPTHHRNSNSTRRNSPIGLKFVMQHHPAILTTTQHIFNPTILYGGGCHQSPQGWPYPIFIKKKLFKPKTFFYQNYFLPKFFFDWKIFFTEFFNGQKFNKNFFLTDKFLWSKFVLTRIFLAAMSSSRRDDVTQSVCVSVCNLFLRVFS